jgi:hypothetical protein
MRMFKTKVAQKIKTHFMFNNLFSENRAVYELIRQNIEQRDRPQMTVVIRCMRFVCWIINTASTQPECVIIIIIALSLQQWLRESPQPVLFNSVWVTADNWRLCQTIFEFDTICHLHAFFIIPLLYWLCLRNRLIVSFSVWFFVSISAWL